MQTLSEIRFDVIKKKQAEQRIRGVGVWICMANDRGEDVQKTTQEQDPVNTETILTALLSLYNLQQSMLAPLSKFGSEQKCQ